MGIWQRICLGAVVSFTFTALCHAQSTVSPEDEYKKLIRVSEDIQPLGANPFGEQVSLYNGSLSFEQTDVSLAGTGPLLQLSRSFRTIETHPDNPIGGIEGDSIDGAFSDWDIEIPRITTNVAYHSINPGWIVTGGLPYARCTHFSSPPTIVGSQGNADWEPHSWWSGYQLIMPGEGSQDLLHRASTNPLAPGAGAASFSIVTIKNYEISCGVLTDDESNGGEGFTVLTPDGTTYTLNHLVYRWAPSLDRPTGTGPGSMGLVGRMTVHPMVAPSDYLQRQKADMLVTKIQDRFGNTLTYSYDAAHPSSLISIRGSDGRLLTLSHEDGTQRITKATLTDAASSTSRVWQYVYDPTANSFHLLKNVVLPDNKQWTYDLGLLFIDMTPDVPGFSCDDTAQFTSGQHWTGTITHPSGLVGSFTLKPLVRGRSYVLRECTSTAPPASYANFPRVYYVPAIASKTFTGAGLSAGLTWNYSYSLPNQSWSSDPCAATQSCAHTVSTDVVDPEKHDVTYTFSNQFDYTESQLLTTEYHSGDLGTGVMRTEQNDYAALPLKGIAQGACPTDEPWPWPWPCQQGTTLQSRTNRAQLQSVSPQTKRTITQDGDNYTWEAESFNAYAQVTKTRRSNSIAGQTALEETTTYRNDTAYASDSSRWVLGLPLQITNVVSGEVESSNTYAANDTLLTRSRFGQPLMSYTFNTTGQLASFTDGNTNTTSLSDYKRGIPQTINYPDTTGETLVVDDYGQITRINDQAGHGTAYSYDPVGRVTAVNYPGGDEVAWTPQNFTYDFVPSAERGVAANHWRRTSTLGNAKTITYFDAMLRPVLSDSDIGTTVQASTLTTYDSKGQKLFTAYPSATALTFTQAPTMAGSTTTYDALGRATQVQQSSELGTLTSSTAYQSGAKQQLTDPKGNVTTSSYQVFDSPIYDAITQVEVEGPSSTPVTTQTIARDIYGNPLSITQFGPYGTGSNTLTKTLTYDSYHRLCRTTEPESGSEVMSYDGANNLAWSASGLAITGTGCGQEQVVATAQTSRKYDAMNRVKTIVPPAGTPSTIYGYDAVGRMTCAETGPLDLGECASVEGATKWMGSYNFRSMLTGESLKVGAQNPWAISYVHAINGSLSLIHYPDGENVSYAPDGLGRPTAVGSYATSVSYWPNGQVKQFVYGNGTGYTTDQNARQLLSNFSYGPASAAQLSEDLVYDKNGNITTVTDLASGPRSKSFGYDALNRLISATAAGLWGTQTYTYDALNNLRTLQSGGQTATYSYDTSNKLTGISGATTASYLYDPRGNVSMKNGTSLTFDQKNQLTNIGAEAFAYDAAGRRVSKVNGTTTTYYFYNNAGQLMYQVDPVSNKATSFIYLGTKMLARTSLVLVIPDAPASISVPATSGGIVPVSWADSANAAEYTLEQSSNGGAWTAVYAGLAPNDLVQLSANGSYSYRVKACNVMGCSAYRTSTQVVITLPPTTAPSLSVPASSSTGSYGLSWTGVSAATSYTLQEQVNGGAWTTIQSSNALIKAMTGKPNGAYGYRVQASNAGGSGPWSSTGAITVGLIPAAPPAPSITVSGPDWKPVFALHWSTMPSATRYEATETDSGGTTTIYNGPDTSASILILDDGAISFQVRACSAYGCSAWSPATGHGGAAPGTAPTLTVPANSSTGTYTVSWTTIAGATRYTLQERINGGAWTSVQNAATTSKAITGKTTGSYGYQVEACNANGCGPWSAIATIAIGVIPAAPNTPTISVTGPSDKPVVHLNWTAIAGATSYSVEETEPGSPVGEVIYTGSVIPFSSLIFATGTVKFRVRACNATGCSAWSGYASIVLHSEL